MTDAAGAEPELRKPVKVGVGMPAAIHLDHFGQWLYDAFGETAYLVGTAATGKTWRDVDVRLMLDDAEFDAMFPGYAAAHQQDPKWTLLCAAVSELGKRMTTLPIDFQFQRCTNANKAYPGVRNPLFLCPVTTASTTPQIPPVQADT